MFVDDMPVKDCYYGAIVRSPIAKGVLKSIECPSLGRGWTLIKASDIPGSNNLALCNAEILCEKNISYIGQPLAIIVGCDKNKLEEKVQACNIEYESEVPVFSLEPFDAPNEINQANETNEIIVQDCYTTGIQEHWVCEPSGAIAFYSDSKIRIFTATEQPRHVQESVAAILGIDASSVVVEEATRGVTLGGKFWYPSLIACEAALASFIIKQNVKIVLTRSENTLYAPKRAETMIRFKSAVCADGTINETQIDVKVNSGACDIFPNKITESISLSFFSSYNIGAVKLNIEIVKTNNPPASPFSGWGESQGAFALERHISHIASVIHEDGLQYRFDIRKNKKKTSLISDNANFSGKLIQASDYKRKWASFELLRRVESAKNENKISPLRGIGFTYTVNQSLNVSASCIVEIEINNIDCGIIIKGIWISVNSGVLNAKNITRGLILRALNYSIGWVASETIKYDNGKITNEFDFIDSIQNDKNELTATIFFNENEALVTDINSSIEEIIFNIMPAAYIEAISQAVNNHIKNIPISTKEIWNYLQKDTEDKHNDN